MNLMETIRVSRNFGVYGPPSKRYRRSENRVANKLMYSPELILQFIAEKISNQDRKTESRTLDKLSTLLLCEYLKTLKNYNVESNFDKHSKERAMLTCKCCMELLYSPITLLCGHSFCKTCVNYDFGSSTTTCITCEMTFGEKNETFRPNMIITSALLKSCPVEMKGRKLTIEGLCFYEEKRYSEAVIKFSEALYINPMSHHATFHRANANYHLGKYTDALIDAIRSTYLVPKWQEAHYLKAEIWYKLHYYEDSLFSMLIGYGLSPSDKSKRGIKQLVKIISGSNSNKAMTCSSPAAILQLRDFNSNSKFGETYQEKSSQEDSYDLALPSGDSESVWRVGLHSYCGDFDDLERLSCITSNTTASMPVLKSQCENTSNFRFSDQKNSIEGFSHTGIFDNPTCLNGIQNLCSSIVKNECTSQPNCGKETFKDDFQLQLLEPSDFTCSLCMSVFYEPICTPCGHVYCRACIDKALDHGTTCPNCVRSLRGFIIETVKSKRTNVDKITKHLLKTYLPDDFSVRSMHHQEDISTLKELQPIFVCTIAFPSMPCPLHVFEPRYRLMLRRCLSYNDREFGMCMPEEHRSHSEIGTLLKVRDSTFFEDGRSIVDCIGFRRFRTSNREKRDGYNVASLTFIVDKKVAEATAVNELLQLINTTYDSALAWFNNLQSAIQSTIVQNYGPFPEKASNINTENGPNWIWWVLAVVPVDNSIKLKILGNNVLKDRLSIINRIFLCLESRKKRIGT